MEFGRFEQRTIHLNDSEQRERVERFLEQHSLHLDRDVEFTIVLLDGESIVATGSFAGNILKCIAVDADYEGLGMAGRVVSLLVSEEFNRGRTDLFLFTKTKNAARFRELGFYCIAEVPSEVTLMENRCDGIATYLEQLRRYARPGRVISGIVMNCNPFTMGHKYLIEKAADESGVLHIFVVWENRSVFPPEVRYRLVKEGTKHLQNVVVHKGKDYIISNATFPTYFLKNPDEAVKVHSRLDIRIFGKYIAPALNITRRYVGEEPYCQVTRIYNQTMKSILPEYGIEVVEIPRLSINGTVVSASRVRNYIREGNLEKVRDMVPVTTYNFLVSGEADNIISRIKSDRGV